MTPTPAPRLLDGRRAAGVCCLRQPEDPPGISPGMCDPDSEWIMCAWSRGKCPYPRPFWLPPLAPGDILNSCDPEPPEGTRVRDGCGVEWINDGYRPCCWVRVASPDPANSDPETWTKIAGNYGPVTILTSAADQAAAPTTAPEAPAP